MQNQYNSCGVVEHDSADTELYIASGDLKKKAFWQPRRLSEPLPSRIPEYWFSGRTEAKKVG